MRQIMIIVKSNNKKYHNELLLFLKKNKYFKSVIKHYNRQTKKRKLSILKSPHVNKKAQEQFEYNTIKNQITISDPFIIKYLVKLKKMQYKLFSNSHLKLKCKINNYKIKKNLGIEIFNIDNFFFNKFKNRKAKNLKFEMCLDKIYDFNVYKNKNLLFSTKYIHPNSIDFREKKIKNYLKIISMHSEFLTTK